MTAALCAESVSACCCSGSARVGSGRGPPKLGGACCRSARSYKDMHPQSNMHTIASNLQLRDACDSVAQIAVPSRAGNLWILGWSVAMHPTSNHNCMQKRE